MSQLGDIAAGLKANLDALDGITVSKYPRSNPIGPHIHLWPAGITYHRAHQMGFSDVEFTVQLLWPYTDDAGSASRVYSYLDTVGDLSIRAAIEADKTLGGLIDRLQVESVTPLQVQNMQDGSQRLTASWTVRIILNGSS